MPPDPVENRLPLDYAAAAGLSPRPKSLLATVGFHYVVGLGASALTSALLLLWRYRTDFPVTLAYGGTFVVAIQWALVALPALCRRHLFGQLLEERSTRNTVISGICGGALVFGVPVLLSNVATGPIASACATLMPLCVYPIAVSFLIFRKAAVTAPTAA